MKTHGLGQLSLRLLIVTLAVSTCMTATARKKKRVVTAPPVAVAQVSDNDAKRYKYFYLEASRQQQQGNDAAAFDLLKHCMDINPHAPEAYFTLSAYYAAMNNDSAMVSCIKRAAELSPFNETYLERLGQVYIRLGNYSDATSVYESLARSNPSRTDVLSLLLQLYQQEPRYDKMIEILERIETIEGVSEDITLTKMRVYSMQGNKKKEYNELKELARQHPSDYKYRVMMGNWLLKNGKEKEALAEFHGVLKKEPDNEMAQMSLYDYYKEKDDSLAMQHAKALLLNPRADTDSKVIVIRQIIADSEEHGGDSIPVLALFDQMLQLPQANADIAGLKAAYMSLKEMPDSLVNLALLDVLEIEPDNASARIELLQNVWKTGDYDRVISLCKPALEYNPDNMAFYYFSGLAYSQKDEIDKSIDAFRRGVSQITSDSNRDLVSDFYAIMGDMLHEKGLYDEAFAAYDSCLQWKPNNIGCLNNYAYYLSVINKDLAKAEQMSYRTVKAEPQNSTYLDTYAWILFRQERFEEARIYIDQALANDSTVSAVIIEHAGDIYMMTNEPDKALEYWQKALEKDGENALLQRKIKLKKYIDDTSE
ncbi:MAG: tetratricopeptide repeat protein [Prevotella sp.]|nr:tetratricopeptide repeat protein [Prevotella sp.]